MPPVRRWSVASFVEVLAPGVAGTACVNSGATLPIVGVIPRAFQKNQRVIIAGASPATRDTVRRLGAFRRLAEEDVVALRPDALKRARELAIERHPETATGAT